MPFKLWQKIDGKLFFWVTEVNDSNVVDAPDRRNWNTFLTND